MKSGFFYGTAATIGLALLGGSAPFDQTVRATGYVKPITPIVFQAAGPTAASIQSMVDAFRAALGGVNNGNTTGPITDGRREINWDGGGSTATSPAPTPFDGFLITRGARFTTRGTGFVQAPVEGMATTFANPSYATIFQAFSPVRLFSPVDSNVTNVRFFVPGGGELPATTKAFGAVFTDVDATDRYDSYGYDRRYEYDKHDRQRDPAPTSVLFFDTRGRLLYTADVPASKGDASLSFLGVLFTDARIARVRINAGSVAPGPDDGKHDIVLMDDFIYGEPQIIEAPESLTSTAEAEATDPQQ